MKKIGLLAYGEMGFSALESLRSLFNVVWVILSPERSNVKLIKFAKKNILNRMARTIIFL